MLPLRKNCHKNGNLAGICAPTLSCTMQFPILRFSGWGEIIPKIARKQVSFENMCVLKTLKIWFFLLQQVDICVDEVLLNNQKVNNVKLADQQQVKLKFRQELRNALELFARKTLPSSFSPSQLFEAKAGGNFLRKQAPARI